MPFNYDKVLESVKKTRKILLASDACERGSALQTMAAKITQFAFDELDAPPVVVGARNWITPADEVEDAFFPYAVGHHRRRPRAHPAAQGLHARARVFRATCFAAAPKGSDAAYEPRTWTRIALLFRMRGALRRCRRSLSWKKLPNRQAAGKTGQVEGLSG